MPQIPVIETGSIEKGAFRVLVTGFGPFANYEENPSWLAVKSLQNLILLDENAPSPVTLDGADAVADETAKLPHPRPIHITVLYVPVTYDFVLSRIPGLHERPPVLPPAEDEPPLIALPEPPMDGYDLVLHVGAGSRGNLRVEKLGHKLGYSIPDVEGKLPPEVLTDIPGETGPEDDAEQFERERAGFSKGAKGKAAIRGFGKGYEGFPKELRTDIDVDKLVAKLKEAGVDKVEDSSNAGRYLCDFTYYCSLASALRAPKAAMDKNIKPTKVLFMHCPPVGEPLETEYVTNALKQIIVNVCTEMN